MKNSSKFSSILILFFVVIFAAPVYWTVRDRDKSSWSLIEYRNLSPFPSFPVQDVKTSAKSILQKKPVEAWSIMGTQFQSGAFPKQFETAASDQFPMRSTLIQISRGFDRLTIRLGYTFENDPAIPADMRGTLVYETRQDIPTLFFFPKRYKDVDIERIDNTVSTYKSLIEAHPKINFYVFQLETLDYSSANPLNSYRSAPVAGKYADHFLTHLPEGLDFGILRLTTFEDSLRFIYRTDHHWNIYGTLCAYEIVYEMLARNYPEISPILPHQQIYKFPDIGFHGSLARLTSYQIQPPDSFEVAMVDLPPYYIIDKNGSEIKLGNIDEYFAGKYLKKPFTDHYKEFYGSDDDFHEFIFENGSDRNLLIIGDSFVNSIERLLASHYHHTYSVDIRNYPDLNFSFSDFLRQHDVDDVLFLGGAPQTIAHSWTISP